MADAIPLRLGATAALRIIRQAAVDSRQVFFTDHVGRRMKTRRITRTQVLECLPRGTITEGPTRDLRGNWTCRMERFVAGEQIGVAVAIESSASLVVITVFTVG
jgi:hypothetical protein